MKSTRWFNYLYAHLFGYFWLPCPRCGRMFGGYECGNDIIWITIGRNEMPPSWLMEWALRKGDTKMAKAKYKIDDWVLLRGRGGREVIHIVDIIAATCSKATQYVYSGRSFWWVEQPKLSRIPYWGAASATLKWEEIELGEIVSEEYINQPFKEN